MQAIGPPTERRARVRTGSRIEIRIAMIARTTRSSTRVNDRRRETHRIFQLPSSLSCARLQKPSMRGNALAALSHLLPAAQAGSSAAILPNERAQWQESVAIDEAPRGFCAL